MDFLTFKKLVCNQTEDINKPGIALTFFEPILDENDDIEFYPKETFELVDSLVDFNIVADMYQNPQLFELKLEYKNNMDIELNLVLSKLCEYQKKITENYNDLTKCPMVAFYILPAGQFLDQEENRYMLEATMPFHIGLISTKRGVLPNTISSLFVLNKCNLSEIENIDLIQAKKEAMLDDYEENRKIEEEIVEIDKKIEFYENKIKELEKGNENKQVNTLRRVGRHETNEEND